MNTWVYVDAKGNTTKVFHSTKGGAIKWDHPVSDCETCKECQEMKLDEG